MAKPGPKTRWWPSNAGDHTVEKVKCECLRCGKVLYRYPSTVKAGRGRYCSRRCLGLAKAENRWRTDIEKEFKCLVCGKDFLRAPSKVTSRSGHCCSSECVDKRRNDSRIKRECVVCGKVFYRSKALTEGRHKAIYCSMTCLGRDREGAGTHTWRGGVSYEPYAPEFNRRLKSEIKDRDGHRCKICQKKKPLQVHHIDYDKRNNDRDNLISLCISCHSKIRDGDRDYWRDILSANIPGKFLVMFG